MMRSSHRKGKRPIAAVIEAAVGNRDTNNSTLSLVLLVSSFGTGSPHSQGCVWSYIEVGTKGLFVLWARNELCGVYANSYRYPDK